MHPVDALTRLGGVADRKLLLRLTTRTRIETALRKGEIVKAGRRGYALANVAAGLRAARALSGIASHESAAQHHGWQVRDPHEQPSVIVPRNRKVEPHRRVRLSVWFRDLELDEHDGLATNKVRTVLDCARDLPFERALVVADAALRSGDVDHDELIRAAARLRGRRAARARRVIALADGRAANAFESLLRAIAIQVDGLDVEPQVVITDDDFTCRPDLVDRRNRIVLEADSYEFHGTRKGLRNDAIRYNALVLRGWTVLRFTWEDVMFAPDYVRDCLAQCVKNETPARMK